VSDGGGAVVLLVDDEAGILAALQRGLRREPYELLVAGSAREALRILEERRVDVVLSDHQMPGMSGLELVREIAARWPATRVLLITGWPADLDATELRSLGVRGLIAKPWDARELRERIRDCL
jgi:DNA-binding response OmpR family regulator